MRVPVDIVLPCFNPNDKWHLELAQFHEAACKFFQLNYIIVNDGSTSGNVSHQIDHLQKQNIPVDYISYAMNKGKGFALRRGVSVAMSDYVVYTDIDFPFSTESSISLIRALVDSSSDVMAGYRNESYYQNKMTGFRRFLSRSFRFFIKRILRMPITDTQCGLKGFNRKGREKFLQTTINRYLFDFEFIYLCCRDKALQLQPIHVELKDNIVFSRMRFKILVQETFNLLSVLVFRKT